MTGHSGCALVTAVDLRLEFVEERKPVALGLVAENIHEPREAVDRTEVRAQRAGEEQRGDGEVLGPRASGDDGRVHRRILPRRTQRG